MVMINRIPHFVLAGILVSAVSFPCAGKATTVDGGLKVIIIRHGEKPDVGDNLSCQGQNRALQLPAVLSKKFGKPAYTYVPSLSVGKSTTHARMFQTASPFAIKYDLTVNSKFRETDSANTAADVLAKKGTVLMIWEHAAIPGLATALGVKKPPPTWDKDDFDSIWIITFATGTPALSFDKEGLMPSLDCVP
jgi:hypothetical protein